MNKSMPNNFATQSTLPITKEWFRHKEIIALLILAYGLLLTGGCTQKPDLILTGTVVDSTTGQPIAGARVADDGYGPSPCKGSDTDAQGKYKYNTWPEEHNIVAQAPGYHPQHKTMLTGVFHRQKEQVLDFELTPEPKAENITTPGN